jgi:hypothetical protein
MATQIASEQHTKPRQFTLRSVMVWIAVLGLLWGVPSFFPAWTVGVILTSVVYVGFISQWITGWKRLRNASIAAVLLFCGYHLLLTGFPFPVYYFERLRSPVAVNRVDKDALQLADGRIVALPLIKEIPSDHPTFNSALRHGVEVNSNGEVYGLVQWPRFCGNSPVVYDLRRINLSELAAALDPAGMDDEIVEPAKIATLASAPSVWRNRGSVPVDKLYEVREMLGR